MALLARCLLHAARWRQSLSLPLLACTVTVIGAASHYRWGVQCLYILFLFASSSFWFIFEGAV